MGNYHAQFLGGKGAIEAPALPGHNSISEIIGEEIPAAARENFGPMSD